MLACRSSTALCNLFQHSSEISTLPPVNSGSGLDYSIDIYTGKAYRPQGFALSVFPSQAKFDPLLAEKI